jgi:dihydrofolate reductase
MSKVKVAGFGVSLDGFAAGTAQSLDHPLGLRGEEVFQWFFPTRTFHQMQGKEGGETGPDDEFARRAMEGFGAFILGRNMFGPVRGEWPDDQWKGWWGDNPPYHAPTFVLTHYPRASIEMLGGTTFHFVSDGIEDALQKAREAAGAKDGRSIRYRPNRRVLDTERWLLDTKQALLDTSPSSSTLIQDNRSQSANHGRRYGAMMLSVIEFVRILWTVAYGTCTSRTADTV